MARWKKPKKTEENVHVAICDYIKLQYPNVVFTSESSGIRVGMNIAKMMKRQRSLHTQPDMIVLEARGGYHGLCIEVKKDLDEFWTKKGDYRDSKHIQAQLKTLDLLNKKGYFACFGGGFDACKDIVDKYMKQELS